MHAEQTNKPSINKHFALPHPENSSSTGASDAGRAAHYVFSLGPSAG